MSEQQEELYAQAELVLANYERRLIQLIAMIENLSDYLSELRGERQALDGQINELLDALEK